MEHLEEIKGRVDKTFDSRSEIVRPCWLFCQEIRSLYEMETPDDPADMTRLNHHFSSVLNIVLFKFDNDWHAGVVWPDGLHFIHAHPCKAGESSKYIISCDRLTAWPWKMIQRGFLG